ncbi:hypothetical protein ACFSZS_07725 [Seohaeicola zhoushanensis]
MSDHDSSGAAWVTAPSRYFESRKAGYRCPDRPFSVYIPMRDGCRIAADIHLPTGGDAPEGGFPTVLVLTPTTGASPWQPMRPRAPRPARTSQATATSSPRAAMPW